MYSVLYAGLKNKHLVLSIVVLCSGSIKGQLTGHKSLLYKLSVLKYLSVQSLPTTDTHTGPRLAKQHDANLNKTLFSYRHINR